MSRLCNFFYRIIDYFDIFRFPLTLTLRHQEKTSTYCGKFITAGILAFILYSFLVSDMISKKNAQTLTQDLMVSPRPALSLARENFTLIFGVANSDNVFFRDDSVFSLTGYFYSSDTIAQTITQHDFKLQLCTPEAFKENPSEFTNLALNGTFCLPDETIKLSGFWDETKIDYIWVELRTCVNSSESEIVCRSSDEIAQSLANSFIDVYITTHTVDSSKFHDPVSRNLKVLYQRLETKFLKSMNIYLKESEITTDDAVLFGSTQKISSYMVWDIETDVALNSLPEDNLLFSFNLYSSNQKQYVTRIYQKFDSLIARIGGICNFLFLLGFFVSKFENHYNIISFMSNELFIFPKSEEEEKQRPKDRRHSFQKVRGNPKLIPSIAALITAEGSEGKKQDVRKKSSRLAKLPKVLGKSYQAPDFRATSIDLMKTENEEVRRSKSDRSSARTNPNVSMKKSLKIQSTDPKEDDIPLDFVPKNKSEMQIEGPQLRETTPINENGEASFSPKANGTSKWKDKLRSVLRLSPKALTQSLQNSEKLMMGNLDHYQKLKQKENYFNVGFSGFIKFICKQKFRCFFKNFSINEELFSKGEKHIQDELDILQILKRLQDVEKLKRVLLNEEQLFFFNLLSKPMITIKKAEIESLRLKYTISDSMGGYREKGKLFEMYRSLQKRSGVSEIDGRILTLLDEDVLSFLKNERIQQDQE